MKPPAIVFINLVIAGIGISFFCNVAFAHNFYKNEASVFFTLIRQFEGENRLIDRNFPLNTSLALEHAENAARLLKDIFYFNENGSGDVDFRNTYNSMAQDLNTTTNALINANLADETLKQYGRAVGFNSSVVSSLTNMSMMSPYASLMRNTPGMMMNMGPHYSLDNNTVIKNQANYQTAMTLADLLKNMYLKDLQNAKLPNSTGLMQLPIGIKKQSVIDLGEGINNLISAISRRGPLDEIVSIVHGQIHPNLFMAFNLKLKGE